MKKIFRLIFAILVLNGCSSINGRKSLIGKWYFGENPYEISELQFYKDSLIYNNQFGKVKKKWKIKEDKIHLYNLDHNSIEQNQIYKYILNENKNSLSLEIVSDSLKLPVLTKANDYFDYFQKKINLNIELPKTEKNIKWIGIEHLNFNIYIGYRNDKLIVKTDNSSNIENLDLLIETFKSERMEEEIEFVKFNLLADKNVSIHQLDSIKKILEKTSINKIFRTYMNDEIKYNYNLIWYGRYE